MNLTVLTEYFTEYGLAAVFVIVLLEYLNLPGFPAGIIMPLAGIMAARGRIDFMVTLFVTVLAGLIGSWVLYLLGWKGGEVFLGFYMRKFPKQRKPLERNMEWLKKNGCIGVFWAKLIPMLRTLISIPAGVIKMDFAKYTISSALGIFLWNLVFVGAGYVCGDAVFTLFS